MFPHLKHLIKDDVTYMCTSWVFVNTLVGFKPQSSFPTDSHNVAEFAANARSTFNIPNYFDTKIHFQISKTLYEQSR